MLHHRVVIILWLLEGQNIIRHVAPSVRTLPVLACKSHSILNMEISAVI